MDIVKPYFHTFQRHKVRDNLLMAIDYFSSFILNVCIVLIEKLQQ